MRPSHGRSVGTRQMKLKRHSMVASSSTAVIARPTTPTAVNCTAAPANWLT